MGRKLAISSTGPLSGKSTLAKYLEEHYGFIRVNLALTLVEDFVETYNLATAAKISVEDVYADKECWRPMLQVHGYWAGFHNPQLAEMWVLRTLAPWLGDQSRDVVIEPIRSEEQAKVLRGLGFTLVQLWISESVREQRATALGKNYEQIKKNMEAHPELEGGIKHPRFSLGGHWPTHVLARILANMDIPQRSYL